MPSNAGRAVVLAVTLLVGACAPPGTEDTAVRLLDDPALPPPEVSVSPPPPLRGEPLWTAPFTSEPKAAGSMFIGVAQGSAGERLRFLAVDAEGRTRWATERDPECTGFAIAHDPRDGSEPVVLLDKEKDPEGGLLATRTTASAFAPDDSERVWGPVDVPGTLVGPGLIFAAVQGSVMSDRTGPKVALDPATGAVIAAEERGETPLHEYRGLVLTRSADTLRAIDSTGGTLWEHTDLEVPALWEGPGVRVGPGPRPTDGTTAAVSLEWTDETDRPLGYSVHDLGTGDLLLTLAASRSPVLLDAGRGRTVVVASPVDEPESRYAFRLDDAREAPVRLGRVGDDERPRALVASTLYLAGEGSHRALDVRTGATGEEGWRDSGEPPVAALEDGPAIMGVETTDRTRVFTALATDRT
ncbi:pyrroloquinoline quinone biosynthesis protein [Nocardiopsis alba]|uniref:pyrroloquinoline quinone biosynthesis protein n=1 Tax=Nocardiopsis alba TaxID=53437 RepID=UPI0033B34453